MSSKRSADQDKSIPEEVEVEDIFDLGGSHSGTVSYAN